MKKRIVTIALLVVLTLGAFTTMAMANAPAKVTLDKATYQVTLLEKAPVAKIADASAGIQTYEFMSAAEVKGNLTKGFYPYEFAKFVEIVSCGMIQLPYEPA